MLDVSAVFLWLIIQNISQVQEQRTWHYKEISPLISLNERSESSLRRSNSWDRCHWHKPPLSTGKTLFPSQPEKTYLKEMTVFS